MAAARTDGARQLILDATRALLADQAMHEISLAGIASRAGVSKGTVYYHFRTKEDILFAVLDEYLQRQWDELLAWTEDPSKDTSLPRLFKYVVERDLAAPSLRMEFFFDAMKGNEDVRRRLLARYRDFAHLIANKIRERTDRVSADGLSWMMLLLADGLLMHQSIGNDEVDAGEMIERMQTSFMKLL